MATVIVIILLVILVIFALRSSLVHMKGEGGCCGGGAVPERGKRKKLTGPCLCKMRMEIEGMHCTGCEQRVEQALNLIEGTACRVSLRKKTAVVRCSRPVTEDELEKTVEAAGYRVKEIRQL